jgi:hypothetical protein
VDDDVVDGDVVGGDVVDDGAAVVVVEDLTILNEWLLA